MRNKIVINTCFGGYGLSKKAKELLVENGLDGSHTPRHHPILVSIVETLGEEANGSFAELSIVEIDSDRYFIEDYDGSETVITPNNLQWILI